jgi:hypothetical protein
MGQLLKEIEPQAGRGLTSGHQAALGRKAAVVDAAISERQAKSLIRLANMPKILSGRSKPVERQGNRPGGKSAARRPLGGGLASFPI